MLRVVMIALSVFCLLSFASCSKSVDNGDKKYAQIEVIRDGEVVLKGTNEVEFGKFEEGDKIRITSEEKFLKIKICNSIDETIVYLPEGKFEFVIPSGFDAQVFESSTFTDEQNIITAKYVSSDELNTERNLAFNPLDYRYESEVTQFDAKPGTLPADSAAVLNNEVLAYPHAYANRVTRNEAQFYSRNAIDGINTKSGHGYYPFHSWGGGLYDDLEFVVYFGREVMVSKIAIAMRCDFSVMAGKEHDTYWEEITLVFSDGTEKVINLEKSGDFQEFDLEGITTTSIRLKNLKRNKRTPSQMYAALNEMQVWGTEVDG